MRVKGLADTFVLLAFAGLTFLAAPLAHAQGGVPLTPSSVLSSRTPTFTWQAGVNATDYMIAVDTAAGQIVYRKGYRAGSVCSGATCSATPPNLLSLGSYVWYVLTVYADGSESWSAGRAFSVQLQAVPLVSPGVVISNPYPAFVWRTVPEAASYTLAIDTAAGALVQRKGLDAGIVCANGSCSYTRNVPLPLGSYVWYVIPANGGGEGPWGSGMRFSIQLATTPLVSPAIASPNPYPVFEWQTVPDATSYTLAIDTAAGALVQRKGLHAGTVCANGTCSYTRNLPLPLGSYVWYVIPSNGGGEGPWGSGMGFSVQALPAPEPKDPSGPTPASRPTFRWKPVRDARYAVEYALWVDDMTPAPVLRQSYAASAVCSDVECAVAPSVALRGAHTWYVLARSAAGDGLLSPGRRFVTPTWSGGPGCAGVFLAADFTGDGRTDQLCSEDGVTNVAVSTGAGFASPAVWLERQLDAPIVADFDGDGAAEVAEYDSGGKVFSVALSSGSAFAGLAPWGVASVGQTDGETYSCGGAARTGSGNFDGNGRADVYCRGGGDGRIFVGRSTGSSFVFSLFADYMCGVGAERMGPADFDGDGRDDWYCIDNYGGLYGRLSNGEAFEDGSFQGPGRGVCERDDWVFADLNGDGRADATCRPNGFVGLSTGAAFLDTGSSGHWCDTYQQTHPDPEHLEYTVEVLRSQMQPMDTDGDRVPELVCTYAGPYFRDVQVRKWTGETLAPPKVLVEGWCLTSIQGGDFDGDGKLELVCDGGAVLRAGTPNVVPDLMVEATNGIGGGVRVGYAPSSSFGCNEPPVRQVATSLTTDDGRGGVATTTYAYCDGRTDPVEGAFLGYGQVQATAPCLSGESACPSTTTFFSQDLRSLGRPTLVRQSDGAGHVLQEVRTFFHPQNDPALPRQALVKEVRTTDFSPSGGESKTTAASYSYGSYGNVTRQVSHGEVTREGEEIPNDELQTDLSYEPPDLTRYVVSLVSLTEQREQRGEGWVPLKRVETAHDPATSDLLSVKTAVLPGGGSLLRTMDYDGDGRLRHVRSELGAETTITWTADRLHPETVTGPEGSVTTLWHPLCDAPSQTTGLNDTTTATTYDELCRPVRTEGPLGVFTETKVEDLGDPRAQHVRVESPGSGGNDYSEQYFDGLGRTWRTTRRGPSSGRDIVTEQSYNARGGLDTSTAPFYENDEPDVTRYAYDPFDRIRTITQPDLTETTKSYELWRETITDPRGKPVTTEWGTTSAKETTIIKGERVTTTRRFDRLGRVVKLDDGAQNVWTWTYDSLDRVRDQQDPDSGPKTIVYDDAHRKQTETDAEGHVVTIAYDTLGRVSTKASTVGVSELRYSEAASGCLNAGRLTSVLSPATSLTICYDELGRVKGQKRRIPAAGYEGTVRKAYDAAGRLSGITYPDDDSIGPFAYDGASRLTSIPGILDSVSYDAAGRPLEQRNANGTVTTRTYFPKRGLLEQLQTTYPASGLIQNLAYSYEDGLPLVKTVTGLVPGESWEYHYDDGYRLARADNLGDVQEFEYDSLGRIRHNSRLGSYEYPSPGEPQPHAPKKVGGELYEYNGTGMLKSGGGRSFAWDHEGRIAAVATAVGTTRFEYDVFGERVLKTSPEGTSLYPFGNDYEVTNGVVTKYISVEGLGVIAKRVTEAGGISTCWLHTDRLGSLQAVTSDGSHPEKPAGTVVFRKTYRPYGETLSETGEHTESRGWIDQRNDPESGLTYLHARYFDPKLGTFLSPDPIGVAGGMNAYGYGFGDPVNSTDRSGLNPDFVFCYPYGCTGDGGGGGGSGGFVFRGNGEVHPQDIIKGIGCAFFGIGCGGLFGPEKPGNPGPNGGVPQQGPPQDRGAYIPDHPTGPPAGAPTTGVEPPPPPPLPPGGGGGGGRSPVGSSTTSSWWVNWALNSNMWGTDPTLDAWQAKQTLEYSQWMVDDFPDLVAMAAPIGGLPPALRGGQAANFVYRGFRGGESVYAGITNDMARRGSEHASRFVIRAMNRGGLLRGEARAVEEALIIANPQYQNLRHSISPRHPWYQRAVVWGQAWLKAHGF